MEGKRVYVITELGFGEILKFENEKYLVRVKTIGKRFEKWYTKDEIRLWSERVEEACGTNRKCWSICGEKIE